MEKGREKSKSTLFISLAFCQLFLIFLFSIGQAQVVIVQTSPRPPKATPSKAVPKASGKVKSRPKPRPTDSTSVNSIVESIGRPKSTSAPVVPGKKVSIATASNLGFPIVKPPMVDLVVAKSIGFPIFKPPMADVTATKKKSPEVPSDRTSADGSPEKKVPETPPAETKIASNVAAIEEKTASAPAPIKPEPKVESKVETGAEPKAAESKKPADKVVGNAKLERMLNYTFDVITSDARGKVASVIQESKRYFTEELPGGVNLEMVEVIGGSFPMGSSESDINQNLKEYTRDLGKVRRERVEERLPAETPQHIVTVQDFYIGKFEVTQAQWRAVASLPKIKVFLGSDPSQFKGVNRPVERVSWEDAIEFCQRLSRATGRIYRLPTEAEWEYACRAGSESPFHFGPAISSNWANFDGKQPFLSASAGESRGETEVAGSLGGANAFGLYDMHGNVWEWCLDGWHDNYRSAPDDGTAWQKGGAQYLKVMRGGSWDSAAVECRSGFRDKLTPTLRMSTVGFRLVVEGVTQAEVR